MTLILSGTDGLSDIDGSAATPAVRGTDANTGIFFGTDIIGFSEGGVEAMRINASGNVEMVGTLTTASRGIAKASMPAGTVLQVVSTTKTDTFTSTTTVAFTDITGFSVSITPSSATSKILVTVSGTCSGQSATSGSNLRLMRDSTAIGVGDAAGSRSRATTNSYQADANQSNPFSMNFLDSPSTTSATTYKVQFFISAGTFYFNRAQSDSDAVGVHRYASTITVMEIAV